MIDDSKTPPSDRLPEDTDSAALPRRDFLKVAGASAGVLLVGGSDIASRRAPGLVPQPATSRPATASSDVVVIGAGAWGSFTALNLRQRGVNVTLVDAYGPGNSRSTSGDESRGVR